MNANPFDKFNVEIPKKFRERVVGFCQTGNPQSAPEYTPFKRQVDVWYMAFLLAVAKDLDPQPELTKDTYNITLGVIFSSDPSRINQMLLVYLAKFQDLEKMSDVRSVFDYCLAMANAGMPELIQILSDPDDKPLWSIFDTLDELLDS